MVKYLAFAVYLGGLGGLILADVLVTKTYGVEDIALWAELRSLTGILSVLCIVGLDQVLVRSPQSSARLLSLLAVQVPVLGLVVGTGVWALGFLNNWWSPVLLAIGSSASMIFFQYFRSHHHRLKSQLSQQGWKIAVMVLLAGGWLLGHDVRLDLLVAGMLIAGPGLMALMAIRHPPARMRPQDPEPAGALYGIGVRFMASSFLLSLSMYAEQLVVNRTGTAADAALYFTHAIYFLFPISIANGYFAFLIGPWIRDNYDRFLDILGRRGPVLALGIVGYAALVHAIGWLGWTVVAPTGAPPDAGLQALFLVAAIARAFYALPSAFLGAFGPPHQHDRLIIGQIVVLALAVGLFFVVRETDLLGVLYAVALASAFNWVMRTAVGIRISRAIVAERARAP